MTTTYYIVVDCLQCKMYVNVRCAGTALDPRGVVQLYRVRTCTRAPSTRPSTGRAGARCGSARFPLMLLQAHAQDTNIMAMGRSTREPSQPHPQTESHIGEYQHDIITRHVTVVMQLANPRHPRPVHISRYYCQLSRSNITRYGPDFDPEYNNNKKRRTEKVLVA